MLLLDCSSLAPFHQPFLVHAASSKASDLLEADTLLTSKAPVPYFFAFDSFLKMFSAVFLLEGVVNHPVINPLLLCILFCPKLVAQILIPGLWRKAEAEAKLYAFTNLAFLSRLENLIHS